MIIYLGHTSPFDSPFSTKMEIFNECTNILLIYHMMCFTDFVADPNRRYVIGYAVIVVVIGNIATHFFFLIRSTVRTVKMKLSKRKYMKSVENMKKIQKHQKEQKNEADASEMQSIFDHEKRKMSAKLKPRSLSEVMLNR